MSTIYNKIKDNQNPFVIAEIGVNYYDIAAQQKISPLEAAYQMIDQAKEAGADAAKFQSYKAEKLVIKDSPAYWDTTKEQTKSQFELFKKFDSFGEKEYQQLADHCSNQGIMFLSTPFDFEAVDYLDELCPIFKVSSSDLTNWPFLKYTAQKNKPVFLSTGASNMDEIQSAAKIILDNGNGELCLLHCVLSYPTKYEDAHISMIQDLKQTFPDQLIGYSDHTLPDPTMTCLIQAFREGGHVLEKHFTLDKTLSGNDHYHAMDPDDLRTFRKNVSDPDFKEDKELSTIISGETKKHCLTCEESARLNARRSIVAKVDIKAGDPITLDALTFKRPGQGMAPSDIDKILNKSAKNDIPADSLIRIEDLT